MKEENLKNLLENPPKMSKEVKKLMKEYVEVKRAKFDPDWMKDPEILQEVIREQMIEYGQVIKEQTEKLERYEKALKEILLITGDTPELEAYTTIVKEALQED